MSAVNSMRHSSRGEGGSTQKSATTPRLETNTRKISTLSVFSSENASFLSSENRPRVDFRGIFLRPRIFSWASNPGNSGGLSAVAGRLEKIFKYFLCNFIYSAFLKIPFCAHKVIQAAVIPPSAGGGNRRLSVQRQPTDSCGGEAEMYRHRRWKMESCTCRDPQGDAGERPP